MKDSRVRGNPDMNRAFTVIADCGHLMPPTSSRILYGRNTSSWPSGLFSNKETNRQETMKFIFCSWDIFFLVFINFSNSITSLFIKREETNSQETMEGSFSFLVGILLSFIFI